MDTELATAPASVSLVRLGSPFRSQRAEVWVAEPADAVEPGLYAAVLNGDYRKPFIVDYGDERMLCFTLDGSVQSVMSKRDPYALVNRYTREMMGFLLTEPNPRDLLLIGLGGGSIAKHCLKHLPRTAIVSVEISADVIRMSEAFSVPGAAPGLEIVHADGADYVRNVQRRFDAILIDAFDREGLARSVSTAEFFRDARSRLRATGALVMNVPDDPAMCNHVLRAIRSAFAGPVVGTHLDDERTWVLIAYPQTPSVDRLRCVPRLARAIAETHGTEFPTLAGFLHSLLLRQVDCTRMATA